MKLRLAASACAIAILAACTENLDNTAACPLLCPDETAEIETITIDPVVLDTTVSALTGQGTESSLLLATRGDTLDARAVIRFDSIPSRYNRVAGDTATTEITTVDSAFIRFRLDMRNAKLPGPVTIQAYDVDTAEADTVTAAVAGLFRPGRLLTTQTFASTELVDSIRYRLPGSVILARRGGRLRIGLRAISTGSVQLRVVALEAGANTQLSFRVSSDTAIRPIVLNPYSTTPADQPEVASSLADYTLLVRSPPSTAGEMLNIGGLPARRVYLRFELPPQIAESAAIVRASLLLTQRPNRGLDAADTIRIIPHVSLAGPAVTDVTKASQISTIGGGDTLKVAPQDSGVRVIDIAAVLQLWRAQRAENVPRALVLLSTTEGQIPLEARFFSSEAAPELRPRLRVSYSARQGTGLP